MNRDQYTSTNLAYPEFFILAVRLEQIRSAKHRQKLMLFSEIRSVRVKSLPILVGSKF